MLYEVITNLAFQRDRVRFPPMLPEEEALLLADPQTSGGLLLFVPEDRAEALLGALAEEGETRITSYNVCYTKLLRTRQIPHSRIP